MINTVIKLTSEASLIAAIVNVELHPLSVCYAKLLPASL